MVGRVDAYRFSDAFKKQYKKFPQDIQNAFKEKLDLFLSDSLHPSLRIKKIQGVQNRWEGSVSMKYRFTFHYDEKTVVFRTIGTNDILKRE